MAGVKKNIRDALRAANVSVLLGELSSANPERQRKIAFELGRRKSKQAVQPLRGLLDSEDAHARASAAEALGKIGDNSAGSALTRLLSDPRQPVFVRDTCAYALARLAYAPALDILLTVIKDPHQTVRTCAASAIAAIVGSADFKPAGPIEGKAGNNLGG